MNFITIRFYGELNDFIKPNQKQKSFIHYFNENPSVKDTLESLGVPHTEVDLLLINEEPASFTQKLQGGERVTVYPVFNTLDISDVTLNRPQPLSKIRFILDVHLGKLASYLRMLGFDTLYNNNASDDYLADVSASEQRILLTFDRELLKRKKILYGYCVRSRDPETQLIEIINRFELKESFRPFERCLLCNDVLEMIDKDKIINRLPENIKKNMDYFKICPNCKRVYWKGSHYKNMEEYIKLLQEKL